ncbi:membrane protein insertase YidC [Sedimentitalea todarodis]|uniref:Membrane protein insertase YidC n=1 Tax=Sedimentitalea todarodis TaxID=1631240 RepID=A0ABU3VI93_9RHOB|nr:membrane protein insertase YidC [Sedimentitalea todarodis]MDU9005912.1 membrane protein insertase YidC [Sedimentitalea todarodis]
MDDQNKNLILATALSFVVILVWFVLFPPPEPEPVPEPDAMTQNIEGEALAAAPTTADVPASPAAQAQVREETLSESARIKIDTPRLIGSVSLLGGRIDDLSLKDYRETRAAGSPIVKLLSPVGTPSAYYALYGWAPGAGLTLDDVPGANTEWVVESGDTLTADSPVTLAWDNGNGLTFRRELAIDDEYMFTVVQSVENNTGATVSLAPYGILARHGEPADLKNFFILHEGVVSMADGTLAEIDYDDMLPAAEATETAISENGWIGFTDHFWMSTLIPEPGTAFKVSALHDTTRNIFQTTAKLSTETVADGQNTSVTTQLFSGAKEWEVLRDYEKDGIQNFVDSIDWGWFFFLTKPIFWLLHNIHALIGNMGWSIIGLTLIIKAILFPLAYKSYVSMAKMKELQPQMEKLKEAAGDDRQKMQQGMMELYKKEKVNPAAGCLPILMQIPIFFSLYKVIFVTIELRQAPWFGPFQDLSAPDPTSIMNFFGLLPFAGPEPGTLMATIFIGILPLLLGISMWLQQKLNPAPTDPTQQMIFAWMPWVFMFMLGSFASGLVVYWIANNTITFTQQYLIMRSQGYKPDVFGNIKSGFSKKAKSEKE